MQKSTKILAWTVAVLLGLVLLVVAGGAITLRLKQPQMFTEARLDTVAPALPAALGANAVLVFSKTAGFRHGAAIDAANAMIGKFAQALGWSVFYTENAAVFNAPSLEKFAVVVWNNSTGAALSQPQRAAFQNWLEGGGGYVGWHSAGDGSHADWNWYTRELIKAPYNQHTFLPVHIPSATVVVEERSHPATAHFPGQFQVAEEWYAWHENPRDNGATILLSVDELSYTPGAATMGEDHPVVWHHQLGQGRVFYSAFGHQPTPFQDALLVPMMEQAILWAGRGLGRVPASLPPTQP